MLICDVRCAMCGEGWVGEGWSWMSGEGSGKEG
jgi:hypothetical protein